MKAATGAAILDGRALALTRVDGAQFVLSVPKDNVVGLPARDYPGESSCGVYGSIAKLSPGEHHLRFVGLGGSGFSTSVSYTLTVR